MKDENITYTNAKSAYQNVLPIEILIEIYWWKLFKKSKFLTFGKCLNMKLKPRDAYLRAKNSV